MKVDSLGAGIISTRSRFTALIRMHNSNHLLDHPSHTNTRKHTIFSLRGGEGGVVYAKSKSEFDQVLKDAGDNLVVVDFTASWCGPCKMIAPFFESLKDNYPNITLLKVDVDENEETAQYFEIGAMPTFMFFKKGKKLGFFCGASEENLRANVEKYINSQADD
ncbi:hypothetical protein AAMO2058_000281900 [Amorphochlora amoebiformis]|uniref:Thioredoxin domain-containing protein n=1 Tax=Amorphochlora amoebiformis TaxID=1561963 RepID=A0A7S0H9G2_9EUKA|mmetsp:Transcript_8148/g.12674  ORF Transcript_8148/g.12674 Transcript_8148/m.12674 type:complete len:163 (+) Transcript_8148:385-873(+)